MSKPEVIAILKKSQRHRNRPQGISLIKQCKQCKRNFKKRIGLGWKLWIDKKYCSRKCMGIAFGEAQKGKNNLNYGQFGSRSFAWKNKVGYWGIHNWLIRIFGKANECENLLACKGISKTYEWAKLKGKKYERKRDNFWMLCHSCHKIYDRK